MHSSSVSTKKNSKAMEEIPEIQKDKVKEAKRDEPIKETSDVKPEQKSKTEPVQVPNKSEKLKVYKELNNSKWNKFISFVLFYF